MKNAESTSARLFDGGLSARKSERPEMCDALEGMFIYKQEFATPDSSIRAIASAIPSHSEQRRLEIVFGHTGQHMCIMVLYLFDGDGLLLGKARRGIVRMQITHDTARQKVK